MAEKAYEDDVKGELPVYNEPATLPKHAKYGRHKKFAGAAAALYLTGTALYYSPVSFYASRPFHGPGHRGHHGHHGRPGFMGHHGPHGHSRPFDKLEGPQYLPNQLVRSDIAEDRSGVPLLLQIEVLDATTSRPVDNVSVDVWQADAEGHYSGIHTHHRSKGDSHRGLSGDSEDFNHPQDGEHGGKPYHAESKDDAEPRGRSRGPSRDGEEDDNPPRGTRAGNIEGKMHLDPDDKDDSAPGRGPCRDRKDEDESSAMKKGKKGKDGEKHKDGKKKHGPPGPYPPHDSPHGPPAHHRPGRPPHGPPHGPPHDPAHGPPPPHHGPGGSHPGPPHGGPPAPPPPHRRPHERPPKDGKKHHNHNETSPALEMDDAHASSSESSWLRGVQQTADDGTVLFSTIFPAPNHHRASHIHYKLHAPVDKTFEGRFHNMDTHVLTTGQLFFDDALVAKVLALAEYEAANAHISLAEDFIFNGQGLISDVSYVNADSIESGIKAKVTVMVDASDYIEEQEERSPLVEIDEFTDSDDE